MDTYNYVTIVFYFSIGTLAILIVVLGCALVRSKWMSKRISNQYQNELCGRLKDLETKIQQMSLPESQENKRSELGIQEVLSVMQGQYDGFVAQVYEQNNTHSTHLNFLFAALAMFITVFSLAMPLITYQVLHKDVVDKLDQQQNRAAALIDEATKLNDDTKDMIGKNERELERMDKAIDNTQIAIENLRASGAGAMEIPGQTTEIQPISDTPKDRARAAYQNFLTAYNNMRYEEALKYINEAIDLEGDNAQYYNSRGVTLHELKRYEEALIDKNKAIELEGDNARYYNHRGVTLYELKRYEEALIDYNKVIELKGDNALYYYNRGRILHALKRYEEALIDYNKAIELEGDNALYYYSRGVTLHELKKYEEALIDTNKAIELEGDNALDYAHRGFTLYKLKRYPEALNDVEQALHLDGTESKAYRVRGLCYLEQYKNGTMDINNASIWNDLTYAVENDADNQRNYLARAQYSLQMKEFDQSKADLEAAMALDDEDPETYHWYARYYEEQGNMEKAREYDALADKYGYIPEPDIKVE